MIVTWGGQGSASLPGAQAAQWGHDFGGAGGSPPPPADPDLVAAVVARLRSFGGAALPAALGEAGGAVKVWSDKVLGSPALPWVRVTEISEPLDAEAPESDGLSHYYGHGELQIDVFAAGKLAARQLRARVVAALDDAPLAFDDGALLGLWPLGPLFPVTEDVAPGQPTAYHAAARFRYIVDRTFT